MERRPQPPVRVVAEVLALGALIGFGWFERTAVSQSVRIVARASRGWLLAAVALELLSMMAFARTQRIALRAAGVRASIPSMAATALAGNAISVSLPLVGPGAGSLFSYARFREVADDPAPAAWALLMSGVISNVVWVFLLATGATVSSNPTATFSGLLVGGGIAGAVVLGALALHRPRSRTLIVRLGARSVRIYQRLRHRSFGEPEAVVQHALNTLTAFRMRPRQWVRTISLSCVNWLASVGCLVAAILAVGASVPWTKVILVYCAGAAASSFNLTPGGLGVTEAVLTTGLAAAGMRPADALGSVLVFRLVSFWLVTLVGWIIYSALRRKKRLNPGDGKRSKPWSQSC
jgi:putative heme transporter